MLAKNSNWLIWLAILALIVVSCGHSNSNIQKRDIKGETRQLLTEMGYDPDDFNLKDGLVLLPIMLQLKKERDICLLQQEECKKLGQNCAQTQHKLDNCQKECEEIKEHANRAYGVLFSNEANKKNPARDK